MFPLAEEASVSERKDWRLDDDDDENGEESGQGGDFGFGRLTQRLLESRTVLVAEVVTDKLYRRIASMVTVLESIDPDKPITVYVNSPGGSADSGFAIYDLLRFTSCPVRTVANGVVASSAVLIYLAADDDKRYSLPNSRFLLHQPSTAARGQASDIEITAQQIVKIRERYNKIVEKHTGRPHDQVERDADRDFWLSAGDAQEYGMVKKIIENRSELD
jgi:ATP-dependent Clp protease protease subunit